MRYYVICGETSGDQHAAKVIQQLKELDSKAVFRGMGGDECAKAGLDLQIHIREMAFMGFAEVLQNLGKVRKALTHIKKDMQQWNPDAVILVDYPGFNLRIAAYAKSLHLPTFYYIAPKAWAWKESRVKKLKANTDMVFSILPFEMDFFQTRGVNIQYVGNPSKEAVAAFRKTHNYQPEKTIALIPGSRKQEIKSSLPIMLKASRESGYKNIKVSQAPHINKDFYFAIDNQITLDENMYQLLNNAEMALVTSGTATLETALLGVPQVVGYKTSKLSYWIGKAVVKVKYISLVNLVLNKPAITELIQGDFNPETLSKEITKLQDRVKTQQMHKDYAAMREELGNKKPSLEVAKAIHQWLEN
jgi:lipid-A-disaccharide synthase